MSVVALARKAPIATPIHIRGPKSTSEATASPAGAQTGVMLPYATDRARPSLAVPR
jgi:hypothetical protein